MQSYLGLMSRVLEAPMRTNRTGVNTRSLFGEHWSHDLRDGFPLLTTKRVPLRWVFEELRWFLSGSTDVSDLQREGIDIWDEWATEEQCAKFGRRAGDLGPVYGRLWRSFPTEVGPVDQIANLMHEASANPDSRRLIVTGWHPFQQTQVALPPCHTLFQVYITEHLDLHLYARSIDLFLGLPFNIASYALLMHLMGATLRKIPRKLTISFGDLHIYENHFKQCEEQLGRLPKPLPSLKVLRVHSLLQLYRWKDVHLDGYEPWPAIKGDVAV